MKKISYYYIEDKKNNILFPELEYVGKFIPELNGIYIICPLFKYQ